MFLDITILQPSATTLELCRSFSSDTFPLKATDLNEMVRKILKFRNRRTCLWSDMNIVNKLILINNCEHLQFEQINFPVITMN